ncbi:Stage II sporulation protein E (SpoIIE) [Posidoniimonas polymericola]|uniref:Stage II sporulation protein E (SpoIIE) n=1 Tax=Posidoniimonas polymericola TaxID=2528002 RepID=A0A5C5YRN5_9BACT|nr:PP2C family protein-serine/threonine phosphatase [Posidoniimonas polymericola]TWT77390.1 Stage II sporulation protein E (SpoIIE) [Posidoniimonas polymericola]
MTTAAACHDRMQCMEVWGGNTSTSRSVSTPGLEVRVHSRPHADASGGGDVHYLSSCASGRITRLLLADVSGHGEGVSRLAVSLRDLMRENVNLIDHTRFVREMNRQFSESLKTDRFATAIVCSYFSPKQSLQICNAGHPAPLLYRAGEGDWTYPAPPADTDESSEPADFPLGVLPAAEYTRLETRLTTGDMLLCFSDAFTESVDAAGRQLGSAGLLEVIRQIDAATPEAIVSELRDRLKHADATNLDQDDATVILVRAVDSTTTLSDNLKAPLRLLRPVRDRTTLA